VRGPPLTVLRSPKRTVSSFGVQVIRLEQVHSGSEDLDAETSMTNYRVFRISKRCHTNHDFLELPLIVIPNLFRDLFFEGIYDYESVNLQS